MLAIVGIVGVLMLMLVLVAGRFRGVLLSGHAGLLVNRVTTPSRTARSFNAGSRLGNGFLYPRGAQVKRG